MHKTRLIAHRGLMDGPDISLENHPSQIRRAVAAGYDAEVDVWVTDDGIYTGHDAPTYLVDESFLSCNGIWIHAKNFLAIEHLSKNSKLNFFWHETDRFTITSKGYIWTYPGMDTFENSVIVLPEVFLSDFDELKYKKKFGICSDYVNKINLDFY